MSTKLGDVWVEVRLDTKRAERDLAEIERKNRESRRRAEDRGQTKAASPSGSPKDMTDQTLRSRKFTEEDMTPGERREFERLRERRRDIRDMRAISRGVAGRRAAGAAARIEQVAGTPTVRQAFGGLRARGPAGALGAMGGGARGLGGLAASATIAGAIYLGARSVGAIGAPVTEFAEGLLGGAIPDSVKQLTNMVRSKFDEFESNIKALFTAVSKSHEFSSAGARITGEYQPWHYGVFQVTDAAESTLDKKFHRFKQDQVARGMGVYLKDVFKQAFSQ